MELEVSTVVERPLEVVWDFYAVHHVENHPRWDPDLKLENTVDYRPTMPIDDIVERVIEYENNRFRESS